MWCGSTSVHPCIFSSVPCYTRRPNPPQQPKDHSVLVRNFLQDPDTFFMLVDKQRSVMPCGSLFFQLRLGILEFAAGKLYAWVFWCMVCGPCEAFCWREVLRGRDLVLWYCKYRQRFFEVRAVPYWHRVGTHKIRTYPPIATIYIEFFSCSMVCVVLVRQFVHFANHFFSATQFQHGFSESCITDEPIVNAQEFSFLAFLLELIRSVMFLIPFFLSVTVNHGVDLS